MDGLPDKQPHRSGADSTRPWRVRSTYVPDRQHVGPKKASWARGDLALLPLSTSGSNRARSLMVVRSTEHHTRKVAAVNHAAGRGAPSDGNWASAEELHLFESSPIRQAVGCYSIVLLRNCVGEYHYIIMVAGGDDSYATSANFWRWRWRWRWVLSAISSLDSWKSLLLPRHCIVSTQMHEYSARYFVATSTTILFHFHFH